MGKAIMADCLPTTMSDQRSLEIKVGEKNEFELLSFLFFNLKIERIYFMSNFHDIIGWFRGNL